MLIRKSRAGSAPGYTWSRDGEVIEVDDELAVVLLEIPRGGFSIAEAPAPAEEPTEEPEDSEEGSPDEEETSGPKAAKKTTAKKTAAKRTEISE